MIASILSSIMAMTAQELALAGGKASIGLMVLGWCLGKASGTGPYKAARNWFWNRCGDVGTGISKLATSRFGHAVVDPLEDAAYDFFVGGLENLFAKLRADNLKKLDKQLDRLQGVGSETRAKAIAGKMMDALTAKARSAPLTEAEQVIFNRAMATANALTDTRINEMKEGA